MDTSKGLNLTLARSNRDLIRKYGHPFPGIEAALDAVPASKNVAVVTRDAYEVELLLGDLARSINDCSDHDLRTRLNELYESIEAEAAI